MTAGSPSSLQVLEAMSDAFFTLDADWRFGYLNPQSELALARRREDLLGKVIWAEFPETVGSLYESEYRRAVRDQVPVQFEDRYEPLRRIFEVRAYPIGEGLAVYFTDVTDERAIHDRLRQTESLEVLGSVTAGVAHDFNNLLAAIRGYANLGQAADVDVETTRYFDKIDEASRKASDFTHQLAAFAARGIPAPATIDLNEVVESLMSLLRHVIPARIALRAALSPQPVPVFVDASQLEQVLLNLAVNSRDAIDRNGSIALRTSRDRPVAVSGEFSVPMGWLQVADTGAGISDDVRPHIFEPGFSTKPKENATGLGLATIDRIISESGGAIFVETSARSGTTVTIALPVAGPPTRPQAPFDRQEGALASTRRGPQCAVR